MAVDATTEAERASREFIHRFWDGDVAWCRDCLTDDFQWIGAQEEQFMIGPDAFARTHAAIAETEPRLTFSQERYCEIAHVENLYIVLASYQGASEPHSPMALTDTQRATFIWRQVDGGGLKLSHYHVSNPLHLSEPNEPYPVKFARTMKWYVDVLASQHRATGSCSLRDVEGISHVMRPFEVVYLEAAGQSTIVHCVEECFRVHRGIGKVTAVVFPNDEGVEVRRGCVVNPLHVSTIDSKEVAMTDGARITLPSRRAAEVRAVLLQGRRQLEGE